MEADVKQAVERALRTSFDDLTLDPDTWDEVDLKVSEFFYRLEEKGIDCVMREPAE